MNRDYIEINMKRICTGSGSESYRGILVVRGPPNGEQYEFRYSGEITVQRNEGEKPSVIFTPYNSEFFGSDGNPLKDVAVSDVHSDASVVEIYPFAGLSTDSSVPRNSIRSSSTFARRLALLSRKAQTQSMRLFPKKAFRGV